MTNIRMSNGIVVSRKTKSEAMAFVLLNKGELYPVRLVDHEKNETYIFTFPDKQTTVMKLVGDANYSRSKGIGNNTPSSIVSGDYSE
jgi:hypothetical protein